MRIAYDFKIKRSNSRMSPFWPFWSFGSLSFNLRNSRKDRQAYGLGLPWLMPPFFMLDPYKLGRVIGIWTGYLCKITRLLAWYCGGRQPRVFRLYFWVMRVLTWFAIGTDCVSNSRLPIFERYPTCGTSSSGSTYFGIGFCY